MVATLPSTSTVMQMIQNDRKLRGFGHGSEGEQKTFAPDGCRATCSSPPRGSGRQPQMIQDNGEPVDPANTMACMAIARKMYGVAGSTLRWAWVAEEQTRQRYRAATWWRSSSCGTICTLRRGRCGRYRPVRCCCHPRGQCVRAARYRRSWEALRRLHRCRQHPSLLLPLAHRCACSALVPRGR